MGNSINEVINAITNQKENELVPEILYDSAATNKEYNEKRQIFNTYYQFRPTAMVFCENTAQVQGVIKIINELKYTGLLRVRSGGHDHEGECTATDALVIDLSKMVSVEIDKKNSFARIQPGIKFIDLIKEMNDAGVGVPHGTCHSVRISGFSFGGGWGPWTRAKGMGCESLAGVTIVLGDGSSQTILDNEVIKEIDGKKVPDITEKERKLLWAIRGGGGMSYGIITELIFKTFDLPKYTTKFTIGWNNNGGGPALKILERWEQVIAPSENEALLGANLKIMAGPKDNTDVGRSLHQCFFYGYYEGENEGVKGKLEHIIRNEWFPASDYGVYEVAFEDKLPSGEENSWGAFAAWDRVVDWDKGTRSNNLLQGKYGAGLRSFQFIPPEVDNPAPHKITSKMVKGDNPGGGLGEAGRKALIETLGSKLLYEAGAMAGISCYVTLGAISGKYYRDHVDKGFPYGSTFPYKKSPYTIQYQVWWNTKDEDVHANPYVNRALDWLEECRNRDIPQTKGAFISFKDSSIPTETYFQESYSELKKIKAECSKDPNNMFSSRKTII